MSHSSESHGTYDMNFPETTSTDRKPEPVKSGIDQVIAEIDALKRRAYDAENVAWTLIVNLEKSDLSATSTGAIRDYAINEAKPFLLRSPNPALPVPAIMAADKAAMERGQEWLNAMPRNWELSCDNEDRSDVSSDLVWIVYEVNGGLNDREWNKLGQGDTPSNAISAAFLAAEIRKEPT